MNSATLYFLLLIGIVGIAVLSINLYQRAQAKKHTDTRKRALSQLYYAFVKTTVLGAAFLFYLFYFTDDTATIYSDRPTPEQLKESINKLVGSISTLKFAAFLGFTCFFTNFWLAIYSFARSLVESDDTNKTDRTPILGLNDDDDDGNN
jgi:ABC-type Fe3+-siderophore transport system permease subunit